MRTIFVFIAIILILSCSSSKQTQLSSNAQYYILTEQATDKHYAFTPGNPVRVGGVSSGPANERRYLNSLLGPDNERIEYYRLGSCCPFDTPNGLMGGGLLDKYQVYWDNCKDTLIIYINMYDKGDLKIPVGLNARK